MGPRGSLTGSESRWLSILVWRFSLSRETLVPIEALMSAPMIWVVFFSKRISDKKFVTWSLKALSSVSL